MVAVSVDEMRNSTPKLKHNHVPGEKFRVIKISVSETLSRLALEAGVNLTAGSANTIPSDSRDTLMPGEGVDASSPSRRITRPFSSLMEPGTETPFSLRINS